ncbi:MAG: hemolysin family protein [Calditrichia bacterium]
MWFEIAFYAGCFLSLLGLSAFFSGSETSYFSLSQSVVDNFLHSSDRKEERVGRLLQKPRHLLITIIVGNTIVNISIASLAAIVTTRISFAMGFDERLALLVDVIVVTAVILVLSEIFPKVVAVRNPQSFAKRCSGLLKIVHVLFTPVTLPLSRFTRLVQHTVGLSEDKTMLSEQELMTLVEVGEEHGALEKEEKEMIHSIFEFGETTVKEIMIPRTDMVAVEINSGLDSIMTLVKSKLLSRIPVYENRIDNVVGILYVKDLLPLISHSDNDGFKLHELMREAHFVPEQKKIDDLLREFQKDRRHMALVVDEYGGISGLVTLEDVIEEIVGEIQDEYDKEQPLFSVVEDNVFLVDGRMSIEEVNEALDLDLPTEEGVETISGFILSLLGSLPEEKERAYYNGYEFVVESVRRNRILKVRILKNSPDSGVHNETNS